MTPNSATSSQRLSADLKKNEECPQPRPLPFYRKLLLTAAMVGNEMSVSLQRLYEVTLLQMLGVPTTLVSLYPVIAGPLAMVLISLNGYISDKGTNHRYRKIVVLIFNSVLMLSGMTTLILTVLLSSSGKEDGEGLNDANATTETNETTTAGLRNFSYHFTFPMQFTATIESSSNLTQHQRELGTFPMITKVPSDIYNSLRPEEDDSEQEQLSDSRSLFDLPLTAVLGIMGISLMDIGYDANVAASRACVLACSSPADHTSLLLLALVMAAAGGLLNCSLGLIDLTQVFDLGFGEGSILPQTTIQLLLTFVALAVFLTSTVITALVNIRTLHANVPTPLSSNDGGNKTAHNDSACSVTSEKSYGAFAVTEDEHDTTFIENKARQQPQPQPCSSYNDADDRAARMMKSASEDAPKTTGGFHASKILRGTSHAHDDLSEESNSSLSTSVAVTHSLEVALYQSTDFSNLYLSQKLNASGRGSSGPSYRSTDEEPLVRPRGRMFCGMDPLKVNLGLACLVLYLGSTAVYSYNLYAAQYLASVVMGGDFNAPEGSAELKAYEQGIKFAAGGLLLVNCVYVASNVLQSKLLSFMGLRLDFCLFNAVMALSVLLLLLTEEMGVYFVTNVCQGLQRSALLTVPFIVAKSYIHEKGLEEKGGSALGKVVGLVSCMIPLNFCTIFLVNGPLISLTAYDGAPLVLTSILCFLVACIFMLYGRF